MLIYSSLVWGDSGDFLIIQLTTVVWWEDVKVYLGSLGRPSEEMLCPCVHWPLIREIFSTRAWKRTKGLRLMLVYKWSCVKWKNFDLAFLELVYLLLGRKNENGAVRQIKMWVHLESMRMVGLDDLETLPAQTILWFHCFSLCLCFYWVLGVNCVFQCSFQLGNRLPLASVKRCLRYQSGLYTCKACNSQLICCMSLSLSSLNAFFPFNVSF